MGVLPLPKNNPIESLHIMFCKHLVGVHKSMTNIGVLLEQGRVPLALFEQKASIKNGKEFEKPGGTLYYHFPIRLRLTNLC